MPGIPQGPGLQQIIDTSNQLKQNTLGPLATLGIGTAAGAVNNIMDVAFSGIKQRQQLKGQKQALQQQNDAQYDMWLKTNYSAQKRELEKAGLNPGLMYGEGGGGGTTTGSASAMPAPLHAQGMDIASAAQLALIKAQTENIKADTAQKQSTVPVNEATVPKIQQETLTGKAQQLKTEADTKLSELEGQFRTRTMEDNIMTVRQNLEKLGEEAQILLDNGAIRKEYWDEYINQTKAEWTSKLLQNEATKKGIELTDAQMSNMKSMLKVAIYNAETQAHGVKVQYDRLAWDKVIHNVSDSTKIPIDIVSSILKGVILVK